jgi:hypothetical protein
MRRGAVFGLVAAAFIAACAPTIPRGVLQLSSESLKQRQLQTRRFDSSDEAKLLSASAAVLQDLGFNIDESETKLGLIVGSKDRDAIEAGQVIGAIVVGALLGTPLPFDTRQKIRVSLVTLPTADQGTAVRVTFQRIVWNTDNEVSRLEALDEPKLYQEFFAKLSQSVFLAAYEL